jgi:hypothetical protein
LFGTDERSTSGREELEAAGERFDDEVFRHWGVHSDHDERKETIFRLEARLNPQEDKE